MTETLPDCTARRVAEHKAAHQAIEGGRIFSDPLANLLLGMDLEALVERELASSATRRPVRLFLACRNRFAEEVVAEAVLRGVRQVVILGAGLDTFALRNPHAEAGLQVFEVDRSALQGLKRDRLKQLSFPIPSNLTFVPVDFESQDFLICLREQGFQPEQPCCFLWLGVSMYLTLTAIRSLMRTVAALSGGEIVFDYSEPLEHYEPQHRKILATTAERCAAVGEPFVSFFEPTALSRMLKESGFSSVEDLSASQITQRYLDGDDQGGTTLFPLRLVHASRP
jgi:methyltransferase (TIGR00027 family)